MAPWSHTSPSAVSTIPEVPLNSVPFTGHRPEAALHEHRQSELAPHPYVWTPDMDGEHIPDAQAILVGIEADRVPLE
jgi:hypothetical protein